VDLPETEDGTELTVLPVSECFKQLIRPGVWKLEAILRLELTLPRLVKE
jgi:hypothetical protein